MTLIELGFIPNLQNIGFTCKDPKISYKYEGEMVEPHILVLITLSVPYLTVSKCVFTF